MLRLAIFCFVILIYSRITFSNAEQQAEEDNSVKNDWGQIIEFNDTKPNVVEFLWMVNDFWKVVEQDPELVFSPKFYVTRPGYRLQLMLIPNTTYSDNTGYTGVFFRLVTGIYDAELSWPYKIKTVLTVVDQSEQNQTKDFTFSVTPNTDPCRLRSAFLRPSSDNDNSPRPDGCGNRRHISLDTLSSQSNRFLSNGTLAIRVVIYLNDFGVTYKRATMGMKYNQLVSNYEWVIKDYPKIQKESLEKDNVVVLTSEPFYTHTKGYLMQMFLTLLPKKKAFAVSIALSQGDHDRYLQWPFPYEFEVAIVDQSPGYWRRDYSVNMQPSTSECGTTPFFHPTGFPDFCFITVQSIELLTLTHYNFITNGTLKLRFTTKFARISGRKQAALRIQNKHLVSEYNWLIPAIEGKIEKYDYVKGKPKVLASDEFYTNGQGYLMQILLSLNHSEEDNEGVIGLQLALIEGEFDGILQWPFNYTYELSIVRQRIVEQNVLGETITYPPIQIVNGTFTDVLATIEPATSNCSRHSFQRPIERNPPCGNKNLVTFDRISRSREFIKLGNLQVKVRIFLDKL